MKVARANGRLRSKQPKLSPRPGGPTWSASTAAVRTLSASSRKCSRSPGPRCTAPSDEQSPSGTNSLWIVEAGSADYQDRL